MHVERNISDNIMRHMFGEKDTTALRRDMEEEVHHGQINPRRALWLQETGTRYIKPKAPFVFTESEKVSFMDVISRTKVPSGYSSMLIKHVGEKKLSGMKSHDHHVLLQQILPSAIRHSLKKGPRNAIIRVGNCFQRICSKVIIAADIPCLREIRIRS